MEGKYCDENGERIAAKLEEEPMLGDAIWTKLSGGSWWPAVVVDENAVCESHKPDEKSIGTVLVRLYGSYEYLHVDPIKCRSEFQVILKENDGCYREIFSKSLEQELRHSKSRKSRGRGSKSKGASNGRVNGSKRKKMNQNRVKRNRETSDHVRASTRKRKQVTPQTNSLTSKDTKKAISKTPKLEGVRKKLKLDSPRSNRSAREDEKNKTPRKASVQKKNKLNTPSSGGTSAERSQKLSRRRVKVMLTLALAAPLGSPFNKNGDIRGSP